MGRKKGSKNRPKVKAVKPVEVEVMQQVEQPALTEQSTAEKKVLVEIPEEIVFVDTVSEKPEDSISLVLEVEDNSKKEFEPYTIAPTNPKLGFRSWYKVMCGSKVISTEFSRDQARKVALKHNKTIGVQIVREIWG